MAAFTRKKLKIQKLKSDLQTLKAELEHEVAPLAKAMKLSNQEQAETAIKPVGLKLKQIRTNSITEIPESGELGRQAVLFTKPLRRRVRRSR